MHSDFIALLIINVPIDGETPCNMLVDTGAECTIYREWNPSACPLAAGILSGTSPHPVAPTTPRRLVSLPSLDRRRSICT